MAVKNPWKRIYLPYVAMAKRIDASFKNIKSKDDAKKLLQVAKTETRAFRGISRLTYDLAYKNYTFAYNFVEKYIKLQGKMKSLQQYLPKSGVKLEDALQDVHIRIYRFVKTIKFYMIRFVLSHKQVLRLAAFQDANITLAQQMGKASKYPIYEFHKKIKQELLASRNEFLKVFNEIKNYATSLKKEVLNELNKIKQMKHMQKEDIEFLEEGVFSAIKNLFNRFFNFAKKIIQKLVIFILERVYRAVQIFMPLFSKIAEMQSKIESRVRSFWLGWLEKQRPDLAVVADVIASFTGGWLSLSMSVFAFAVGGVAPALGLIGAKRIIDTLKIARMEFEKARQKVMATKIVRIGHQVYKYSGKFMELEEYEKIITDMLDTIIDLTDELTSMFDELEEE